EAANAASEARARAEKNMSGLQSLRNVVSNLDDYQLVAETTVQFEYGQDRLTPEAKKLPDVFAAGKGSLKHLLVVRQGFKDSVGSTEYNNTLSKRRAEAVIDYLATEHNTPRYRMYAEGFGSRKPVDQGNSRAARSKNRRVNAKIFSADLSIASSSSQRMR